MELLLISAIISMIVGVTGGVCGIVSLVNQRRQIKVMQDEAQVMQDQLHRLVRQEGSLEEWATKYDEAADALTKIGPSFIHTGPSTTVNAYPYVFSSEELRSRIERYLGHRRKFFGTFRPASLTTEQLQNPVVQKTIREALDAIAKFKAEHTDFARALKLLPPN